jgi:glutamate dehydrogenase
MDMSTKAGLGKIIRYAVKGLKKDSSKQLSVFIPDYFNGVPAKELAERNTRSLAGIARSHFELAQSWTRGHRKIRIYNPDLGQDAWESKYTIIQIVTANIPFLIDSVMMELNRLGYTINLTVHPILHLQRGKQGKINNIIPFSADIDSSLLESFIYMEVDKENDAGKIKQLASCLNRILEDTRLAVADRQPMTNNIVNVIDALESSPGPVNTAELKRSISFLRWLLDNNFIFLGYRGYDLNKTKQGGSLRIVPGSGRGILREHGRKQTSHSFDILPEKIKKHVQSSKLLIITKSNSRSTVHRPVHLDYIGILRFNKRGRVVGEHRILGLYTSSAYMSNPQTVPLIKDRIERVMEMSGLLPESHASKALLNILHTYPRDELLQTDKWQLHDTAMGILHLQERQQVRLFVRRDPFDRFFACIVYIPKERFHSNVRERIQSILRDAFNGTNVDFSTSISESVYAQLYLIIHTRPGTVPKHDLQLIEANVAAATRSWADNLKMAFQEKYGKEQSIAYFDRYQDAYPASYMEDHSPDEAVLDSRYIDLALEKKRLSLNLYRDPGRENKHFMLKLFLPGAAIPLSTVLPVLENMGLFIDSERPYEIHPQDTDVVWVHDFGMQYDSRDVSDLIKIKDVFQEAFRQIWDGKIENDGFNRLVLCAGLSAREIMLLRAYAKYIRQLGTSFSEQYVQDTLHNNPHIAKLLVRLFIMRFNPQLTQDKRKPVKQRQIQRQIESGLDAVSSLDEDRILGRFYDLIKATQRTNYFQTDEHGDTKDYLSLKISPELVPDLPHPYPKYEIFVYSPRVEGVHLRGGKVARGGLRWSDRREDFRTEVLGLMKAQMVKNAVIVPVGAKGGFYVKQAPVNDRQALQKEGIDCYKIFIRGLLDITDNRIGDEIIAPLDVVRYDDDDPYLVVAADKGTATFSDIANALAAEYKFWLGDAFASGGSEGYDHKKMGITARGAWESVKYNFQALGIDIQNTDFTVIGIGDMAGDVFGNGMLLSPHIKLLAAFNHLHIFIDPDPDPATSFAERQRLFELPRSSWTDYDGRLISSGGDIYPRSAKSIQLSSQVKTLLQVNCDQTSPDELIRMLLMAPVDLLWNGGIGTYVKADDELNMNVGDKANDNLRINSSQLNCKVIGEGGNLGFTQRARIAFAQNKGRVNADWIDNSGGVDCSDREVNIKILLNKLLADGKLSLPQRNRLLRKMTDNVSEMVLQDNYRQVRVIDVMEIESIVRPGWYALLIDELEKTENFSRVLEHIPDQTTIDKRKVLHKGFSHPETAVLLAHTKAAVYNEILESDFPEDDYLTGMLIRYFPVQLQKKYSDAIKEHRLRREIIATVLTNSMINRAGITFAHRLVDETGASLPIISKAFLVARDVFDIHGLWHEIDKLDHKVSVASQAELVFETQHLLRHATRWFVRHEAYLDEVTETVRHFSSGIKPLKLLLRKVLTGNDRKAINAKIHHYRSQGIPARIASRFASLRVIIINLELSQLALQRAVDINLVIKLFFQLDSALKIHTLRYKVDKLTTDNVWQDRARVDFVQDLNQLQTALTSNALDYYKTGDEVAKVVELWLNDNANTFRQYQDVYDKMKFTEINELAMLSVVLSKLRKFI